MHPWSDGCVADLFTPIVQPLAPCLRQVAVRSSGLSLTHSLWLITLLYDIYLKKTTNCKNIKKLNTNQDTHCIKIGVQLWFRVKRVEPQPPQSGPIGGFLPFPASERTKIHSILLAVGCYAVFTVGICNETKQALQKILGVFARRLTKYRCKSTCKNRFGFDYLNPNYTEIRFIFQEAVLEYGFEIYVGVWYNVIALFCYCKTQKLKLLSASTAQRTTRKGCAMPLTAKRCIATQSTRLCRPNAEAFAFMV